MYDYAPQTCLIKDVDGKIYNIIDLWNGEKTPVDLSVLKHSYAPRSCLVENIDGTTVNIIDTILKIATSTGGAQGQGPQGPAGPQGPKGEKGDPGTTPTISIGTVTTLEPGQQATVTKRGGNEAPIFDFGIPKGDPGTGGTSTSITKQDIEKVLTGNITTHTHDQYAKIESLVDKVDKTQMDDMANSLLDSLVVKLEAKFGKVPPVPKPCTKITINPNPVIITKLLQEFTVTAITEPELVSEEVTWDTTLGGTTADLVPEGKTVKIQAWGEGTGTLTATCGTQSVTVDITITTGEVLTTSLNFHDSKLVFNNNGEPYAQNIKTEVFPRASTQETTWTVVQGDPSMVRIEPTTTGAKVIPLKIGKCVIEGTSGRYKDKCEVINVQHSETDLLTNPTIKMENYKAVLTENGYTERFDVSYEPNTGHPQYAGYKEIRGDDGTIYYLTLLKTGTSKFRVDGKIPDSGIWKNILSKNGDSIYQFILTPFPKVNNFNFSYTVKNNNNTVYPTLFSKALKIISTALPALNITEDVNSVNTMTLSNYADDFFGVQEYHSDHFDIKINARSIQRAMGSYEQYPNRWLSTAVHELGHTLGIRDYPKHKPSLYDYGASPDKSWYMQPCDLAMVEYYYKFLWDVDVTLTQEEITRSLKNRPKVLNNNTTEGTYGVQFNFREYTNEELLNISDVIGVGELEFIEKEAIKIGEDLSLVYNVYRVKIDTLEKGKLLTDRIKIHESMDVKIKKGTKYKLNLIQYANTPSSILNIQQGLKIVK